VYIVHELETLADFRYLISYHQSLRHHHYLDDNGTLSTERLIWNSPLKSVRICS
jgi:hypothetical protein